MTSLFLLALLSSLVFVCAIYIVHYRGNFSPLVQDERFDLAMASKAPPVAVDPVAAGKRLYNTPGMCVTCRRQPDRACRVHFLRWRVPNG